MSKLKRSERLEILEMAADIAAGAAHNHNVQFMIEFQEELVERLYRRMVRLVEEDSRASSED